jgi:hypothetical protein
VIEIEASIEGLKPEPAFLPWLGIEHGGPATWSSDRMKVNIVTLLAILIVLQMDFNRIPYHHSDHGPWYGSSRSCGSKTPELIVVIVA